MPLTTDRDGCRALAAQIEPLLDGELAPRAAERAEHHLEGCASCRQQLAIAERIKAELNAYPRLDAPPHLIARIKSIPKRDVERRAPASFGAAWRWWSRWRQRPLWAGAMAAATAAILVLTLWPGAPPPTADPAAVAAAAAEARYALALVAKLTRQASSSLRSELDPQRFLAPAAAGLARSLEHARTAAAVGQGRGAPS